MMEGAQCHDFQITTSLLWTTNGRTQVASQLTRLETNFLDLHCDRIVAAARAYSWKPVLDEFDGEKGHQHLRGLLCQRIPAAVEQTRLESAQWKIRILVSRDGNIQISPAPTIPRSMPGLPPWPLLPENLFESDSKDVCQVFIDRVPTPTDKFSLHKTTSRQHYDEARSRCGIEHTLPMQKEVLLFNEHHEVVESSVCTPYFQRHGVWITPPLSSGGIASVSRRMALEAGLCVEKVIQVDELVEGETIWLSNAVRGFIPARLQPAGKEL